LFVFVLLEKHFLNLGVSTKVEKNNQRKSMRTVPHKVIIPSCIAIYSISSSTCSGIVVTANDSFDHSTK
jgi:hypothetical protein